MRVVNICDASFSKLRHISAFIELIIVHLVFILLLLNFGQHGFFVTLEELMRKNFLIFRVTRFLKVVHVELAHERREVVVFEILWEHLIRKLV